MTSIQWIVRTSLLEQQETNQAEFWTTTRETGKMTVKYEILLIITTIMTFTKTIDHMFYADQHHDQTTSGVVQMI